MTPTPITTNKDCLLLFAKKLSTFLDEELSIDDSKSPWKDDWISLKNAGFGSKKFSRLQLAKHVLGLTAKDKSVPKIIAGLRSKFPPIDKKLVFIPTMHDTDLWHMDVKPENSNDETKATILSPSKNDSNENTDEEENEVNTTRDSTIDTPALIDPIDKFSKAPVWTKIPVTTKQVPTSIPMKTTPFASKNHFDGLFTPIEDIDDDEDLSLSATHDINKTISSDQSQTKSTSTQQSIKATNPHEIIDLSAYTTRTIAKINNLRNEGKDLTEHANLDEILLWIETKVNQFEKSGAQRETHLTTVSSEFNNKATEIYDLCNKSRQTCSESTKICNGMQQKMKKEKDTVIKDINKAETSAIEEINRTANRRKTEAVTMIDEMNGLISKMKDHKSVPEEILKQVQTASQVLKDTVENIFDDYEERTNEMIDTQKVIFRSWLENLMGNNTMKAVHDLVQETETLKASRLLLDIKHKEIDSWFINKKQEFEDMKIRSEHVSKLHSNNPPMPQYQTDTAVRYQKGLCDVYGYIMDHKYYANDKWYYELHTMNGATIQNVCEEHLKRHEDNIPQSPNHSDDNMFCKPTNQKYHPHHSNSPFAQTSVKQENMSDSTEHEMRHHNQSPWTPSGPHNRQLANNEFRYPHGSFPLSVNQTQLIKHAEKWIFEIRTHLDLRGFYDDITNQFRQYHIYLRSYEDIVKDQGIELITPATCQNYETARKQMSQAIMSFFQTYGKTIFNEYTAPLDYITAFKANSDGLGFLKRIMKKRHPKLKDVIDMKTPSAPIFQHYQNIHLFIQAYIEWLHDEQLRGGRTYNDKEQLDYVLTNLDERFSIAVGKIEENLIKLYADPFDPQPIPLHLQVTYELGMYISDLIPDDKKEDLTNAVPKLFAVSTRPNKKNDKSPKERYNNRNTRYRQTSGEQEQSNDQDVNVDDLQWRIIPGATCPACKKNNHNVYKTGCPALGLFAHCQEFYDSQPKKLIEKVKGAYNKYQRELGKKMLERRNKDRRTLRTVAATYGENELGALKVAMFDDYKDDFKEEQYAEENPFDDFYYDEPTDDDDSDVN